MKSFSNSFRSLVFFIFLTVTAAGILTVPAFTQTPEIQLRQESKKSICEDCYIVYVWIEGVRWAQVYDTDGKMVNMYPDPED